MHFRRAINDDPTGITIAQRISIILPNVKFTRGDGSPDKRLKFQFCRTDFKPDMSATSRRVQRLVLSVVCLAGCVAFLPTVLMKDAVRVNLRPNVTRFEHCKHHSTIVNAQFEPKRIHREHLTSLIGTRSALIVYRT